MCAGQGTDLRVSSCQGVFNVWGIIFGMKSHVFSKETSKASLIVGCPSHSSSLPRRHAACVQDTAARLSPSITAAASAPTCMYVVFRELSCSVCAVRCGVLQCVAALCTSSCQATHVHVVSESVLWIVGRGIRQEFALWCGVLRCAAVCCSVTALQRVAES